MAITVSFNGATIRKPGGYSKTVIDLGGNFPISPVGVVGLIGEAPRGKPGSAELIANNVFTAGQLVAMRDKYGPGSQLADAASLAFAPSNDALIVNGAQAAYLYKTNSSTQAQLAIPTSYGLAKSREYGEGGNLNALTIEESTAEVLPSLAGLHYLPSSSASGASDFQGSANGGTKQDAGVIAAYGAAAGGSDAFVAAFAALTSIASAGGAPTALFAGTDNTTELTAANASGVTTFTISAGAGSFGACAAGSIFVVASLATASFNGVYLCTAASTATTISGVKLKDLATNAVTAPVPGTETFGGANTASRSFTSLSISVDAAQAQAQGSSLQLSLLNNRVYGGTARSVLSSAIGNVGTIKFGNAGQSFASVTVTITGGTWVSMPQAGDLVWILPDSQLAGASNANCGAYYVTAATQTTVTLTKVDQSAGTYAAVSAATITTAGVTANLRCFVRAQTTPNYAGVIGSSAESKRIFTIENTRDALVETSDEVGGRVSLKIGYGNGSASAATVTVNQSTKRLTTTVTGVASVDLNINLLQYPTLQALAAYISAQPGYKAEVDAAHANVSPLRLDDVSGLGILSLTASPLGAPGRVKQDAADVKDLFAESSIMEATVTALRGLPSAMAKAFLAGGIVGSTSAAAIMAALDEFEKVRINTVVPLFSRDAASDIAESKTDESSSYLIDSIHAAVKTHCILMSDTKNRSERHCVLAFRGSYADAKDKAAALSSFRSQLVIQDVRALSTDGQLKWMQPHMLAAQVAGMRSGATVGLPLTFKFFNVSGIRHTTSQLDEVPEDVVVDFEPRTQYDDAIDSGITFLESPASGGFRCVVDNTTYTKDDNWVFNRMATLHAADVVAYDFRTRLENTIVGARNTDFTAVSIRSLCEALLSGYKGQGLLGSKADAPNGFSNLSVRMEGNTVIIDVTVILVEGIDFVLSTISLTRNSSAA
jgi:hypothetical protein